ncbi:MAG: hypothetical protein MI725_09855, partial [Pirellulales bacterium]|nr:hypothetical protein [Pirellulales bacterium]
NVWEWVSKPNTIEAPEHVRQRPGTYAVLRGGSCHEIRVHWLSASSRLWVKKDHVKPTFGFRVAKTP